MFNAKAFETTQFEICQCQETATVLANHTQPSKLLLLVNLVEPFGEPRTEYFGELVVLAPPSQVAEEPSNSP